MLYNVPARTGCSLALDVLKKLNEHPNFWALKEASGSAEEFSAYVACAGRVVCYSGNDALMPELCRLGAKGLVSVMGNVWPKLTSAYVGACLSQEFSSDPRFLAAIRCVNHQNPISVKVLLEALKSIQSSCLRLPLCEEDGSAVDELLLADRDVRAFRNLDCLTRV